MGAEKRQKIINQGFSSFGLGPEGKQETWQAPNATNTKSFSADPPDRACNYCNLQIRLT
jgi:hypothetical protein